MSFVDTADAGIEYTGVGKETGPGKAVAGKVKRNCKENRPVEQSGTIL